MCTKTKGRIRTSQMGAANILDNNVVVILLGNVEAEVKQ